MPHPAAGRPSGHPAGPPAGRHRRRQPPSRLVLVGLLAVLALLLGSGTAISLTAAAPAPPSAADPDLARLGPAPTPGAAPPPEGAPGAADVVLRPDSEPAPAPEPGPDPESPPPADDPPDPPDGPPVDEITAFENEVTELTNTARADAGCGAVSTDERLRTAARGHSQDMAANDYFSHTGRDGRSPFDRMRDAGYPDPAGENIAMGYRTPTDVMAGWMDSEGHRNNLLTCSHQTIGVGLAYDDAGRPYWTQVFGR